MRFEALGVYRDRRLVIIAALGFASGLPLLLTFSTLSYWLRTEGVDVAAIGLFALVGLPYALKFSWAPVFDHAGPPSFGVRLGRRRGWLLIIQLSLALAVLVLGASQPTVSPLATAAAATAVAFLSASQDIVIDAYRIEILSEQEQGAGAAAAQLGYRIGTLVAGAGAIALSDFANWSLVYALMAALGAVGVLATLLAAEPDVSPQASSTGRRGAREAFRHAVLAPFLDFTRRRSWLAILIFALLYKFGDAIGGGMANPFYVDLGFSGVEIASVTKFLGLFGTLAGVFAGGALVARFGVLRALVVGGVLQALTNLLFAWQALVGKNLIVLAIAVGTDNFTGGLGSAAFVAYLSGLCSAQFTATQYALLTSLTAAGRTLFAAGGGWLAAQLSWASFYALTTLLAVPGLMLLAWLMRDERG